MSTTNNPNDPEGSIPLEHAIELTANWRNYLSSSEQAFHARSFLVPIATFKNILLHNPTAESVRVYIGLENAADPTTAKLVFAPVVNGENIHQLTSDDGTSQSNVFDLSAICPPYCAPDGVLDS